MANRNLSRAQFHIQTGGDAVPGGYNGYYSAHHPETGEQMGYLDYQTASHDDGFKVAMVKVHDQYRGQGVAAQLLLRARKEMPGRVNPGMLTEEGHAWWQHVGRPIAKNYKPKSV